LLLGDEDVCGRRVCPITGAEGRAVRVRFDGLGRLLTLYINCVLLLLTFRTDAAAQASFPSGDVVPPSVISTPAGPSDAIIAPTRRVQRVVDDVRKRLSIPPEVIVAVVPHDALLVSVERRRDQPGAFTLSFERDFLDGLSEVELTAVVAHELGHVWIFTHFPYLQTEELANEVALRIVSRDTLQNVYDKVWQRTGVKGALAYLPQK
jgi:hypothetical protein